MCEGQYQPSSVIDALRMLDRSLDYLNGADAASLPSTLQAEALRGLARGDAKQAAARARVLAAFTGQAAYEDDGHGSPAPGCAGRPGSPKVLPPGRWAERGASRPTR